MDAVNHFFGPSSLENEDVVLQLDRTLADLLKYVDKKIVRSFFRPYLYLDGAKLQASKLDREAVEQGIANALTNMEGIALAVPRNGIPGMEGHSLLRQVRRNYHPSRSGEIYVAQDPYWFLFDKGPVAMHGSPGVMTPMFPLSLPARGSMPKALAGKCVR